MNVISNDCWSVFSETYKVIRKKLQIKASSKLVKILQSYNTTKLQSLCLTGFLKIDNFAKKW